MFFPRLVSEAPAEVPTFKVLKDKDSQEHLVKWTQPFLPHLILRKPNTQLKEPSSRKLFLSQTKIIYQIRWQFNFILLTTCIKSWQQFTVVLSCSLHLREDRLVIGFPKSSDCLVWWRVVVGWEFFIILEADRCAFPHLVNKNIPNQVKWISDGFLAEHH